MQRRCLLEKQTKSHRILEELRFTEAQVFAAVEQPGPLYATCPPPLHLHNRKSKYFVFSLKLKKHEATKTLKVPQPVKRRGLLEKQNLTLFLES